MKIEIGEIEIQFAEMTTKHALNAIRYRFKNYEGLNKIYNKNVKEMLLLVNYRYY